MFTGTQRDWSDWVSLAAFNFDVTKRVGTGSTPSELGFGRLASVPSHHQFVDDEIVSTYQQYLRNLLNKLDNIHTIAEKKLRDAKLKSKETYDKRVNPKVIMIGDYMWLHSEPKPRKLENHSDGPFLVLNARENGNIMHELSSTRTKIVHSNRSSDVKNGNLEYIEDVGRDDCIRMHKEHLYPFGNEEIRDLTANFTKIKQVTSAGSVTGQGKDIKCTNAGYYNDAYGHTSARESFQYPWAPHPTPNPSSTSSARPFRCPEFNTVRTEYRYDPESHYVHEIVIPEKRRNSGYQLAGHTAISEFIEVTESEIMRERLAIYGFITGLHGNVKRYMCDEYCYPSLFEAVQHARRIGINLINIHHRNRDHFEPPTIESDIEVSQ
ncbi:hypothetical protein QAD02_008268 [Eretmocerus hayati]|uniref:Uncharacterized protein n=1 Tax=Eretmocerus hayati TaxID=131215 RepID=A0ACC2N698_9HYME|nr:hypothetical protein QAD02_008268 [Eretmocerus hayati]